MRRITTLALATAMLLWSATAVLAQPGPPENLPGPPEQAQGPETGQQQFHVGRDRAAGAAENGAENRQHGMDASQEGRARASEQSGHSVPVDEQAREDGRSFGQQRAEDARQRGSAEEPGDVPEPGEVEEPADLDTDDFTDAVDGQVLPDDVDAPEIERPELPDAVEPARGVLDRVSAVFERVLQTLRGLFFQGS